MRRLICLTLTLVVSGAAMADLELAKSKNCMTCHAIDVKLFGPAYKDVANKYADQKDAENKLIQKVLKGGSGNWGPRAMPPNTQVTEPEARTLVKWILMQK